MGADESGLHARPIILNSSDLFRRTIPSPSSKFLPFQTTEIETRPIIDSPLAKGLESVFKILGNHTRLRLLHALVRHPDLCVGEIAEAIGMKPQAVSNQLQRLADKGILVSRRSGLKIHYRIVDPCVVSLLDKGLCLLEDLPQKSPSVVKISEEVPHP